MKINDIVSGATLGLGVGAFGLAGALSLRAGVEPLYAVVRGIIAFLAVVWIARWSANTLSLLNQKQDDDLLGLGPDKLTDSHDRR